MFRGAACDSPTTAPTCSRSRTGRRGASIGWCRHLSASGKGMLLHGLAGLLRPSAGEVVVAGRNPGTLKAAEIIASAGSTSASRSSCGTWFRRTPWRRM